MAKVKVFNHRVTDRVTDRQTESQTGQKQDASEIHSRGIKTGLLSLLFDQYFTRNVKK